MKSVVELFADLAVDGGAVVCSNECSEVEIAAARACGRFAVDGDGFGYVRRPKEWLVKQNSTEGVSTHGKKYRWEQCYEMDDGIYWAIVDDDSEAEGLVTSHLLVVHHCWAESLGTPFPECDLPKRIINLLNVDDRLARANAVMMRRLTEIATGEAIQPAIHAAAGIEEAESILRVNAGSK